MDTLNLSGVDNPLVAQKTTRRDGADILAIRGTLAAISDRRTPKKSKELQVRGVQDLGSPIGSLSRRQGGRIKAKLEDRQIRAKLLGSRRTETPLGHQL